MKKVELPTISNLESLSVSPKFIQFILKDSQTIEELKYWCEKPINDWPYNVPDDVEKQKLSYHSSINSIIYEQSRITNTIFKFFY